MANFDKLLDTARKTNTLYENGASQQRTPQQQHLNQQQQQQGQNQEEEPQEILQLFIWGNHEKASRRAIRMAQDLAEMGKLEFVDVRQLEERPEWLRGVPTLYSEDAGVIWEGTECLDIIEEFVDRFEEEHQEKMAQQQQQQPIMPQHQHLTPEQQQMLAQRMPQQQQQMPQQMALMPQQTMPDGTVIQQRMPQMMRGADDNQQELNMDGRLDAAALSDTKVSSNDMKPDIDAILKRRQAIIQQPTGPPSSNAPLPSMSHRS